ncbi:MAG TPA: ABC transporter ATP-binding protein [Candidatus Aphodocola excrementigallinarum]|uniref:ABC transporter ATP-binding protein n=1 Tax=Candidatus Aphodocola excrementigallinarum TaxID=2840670 RepID=A0A9D1IQF2_9FIRM|nr:ABC transporter ATP-binding protein [Candidatus Aphodocola excrementigallinarum]
MKEIQKKKNLKELKNIYHLVKQDKWKLLAAFMCILISSIFSISNGYLQGEITESIIALNIKAALLFLGIYFILCVVFNNFISNIGVMIASKIESNLSRKLSIMVYKKTLDLPSYAFEEKTSGELINRITSDTETLSNTFNSIIQILINAFGCLIILIYIFFNSWIVGVEILVFLVLIFAITKFFNPKIKRINKELKAKKDEYTALSTESIRGIREIKTLGIKKNLINEVSNLRKLIFNKDIEDINVHRTYSIIMHLVRTLLEVIVFATCLIEIYFGRSSIGFFMAMTWYVYKYTWLVDNLTSMNRMYQRLFVSLRRINEVIDNTLYDDEKFGKVDIKNPNGVITFDDVTFNYPNEKQTLNNFSVKFNTNKKIAVVGKSGQGKSTLFNLITRIFDCNTGNIYLDNINIKDLTEVSLRKNISVIRQEPFLFNRTIIENFKVVKPNITLKEVKKYCKMAYLDDYIESLPEKYDTKLGEGGVNLSGGQKQRLSIARALAKESKVILFDEATSALDNESQSYIKKVIDDLVKDHTVIIIAHRLSTIVDADKIYVVDKGKIVDSGTHKELLKKSKVYKKLYENEDKN